MPECENRPKRTNSFFVESFLKKDLWHLFILFSALADQVAIVKYKVYFHHFVAMQAKSVEQRCQLSVWLKINHLQKMFFDIQYMAT